MKIQIQQNFEIKLVSRLLFDQKSSFLNDYWDFKGLGPSLISTFCWFCIFIRLAYLINFHNGLNHNFSIISSHSINKNLGLMWIRPCKMPTKYWKTRFSKNLTKTLLYGFSLPYLANFFVNCSSILI